MKKIYLFLAAMMGIASTSSAQIIADLEAQLVSPTEVSAQTSPFDIPCNDSFYIEFLIVNKGPGTIGATDTVYYQLPLFGDNQVAKAGHGGQAVPPNDTIIHAGGKIKRSQLVTLINAGGTAFESAPFADGDYVFYALAYGFKADTTVIKDTAKSNNIAVSKVKIACQTGISFTGLSKQTLNIYPNPAADIVRFMATLTNGNTTVRVSDISGRSVLVKDFGKQNAGQHELALDVTDLRNGMYYIELINGDKRAISKLTIQR